MNYVLILQLEFILEAVALVSEKGWTLLPQYIFTAETGEWFHQSNLAFSERKCMAK